MSTIDPYVGQSGTPGVDSSVQGNGTYVAPVHITFTNDDPHGKSPDQPVTTATAKMVESAAVSSGVQSINVNSTTGGDHTPTSAHYQAKAVDINKVNGSPVSSNGSGVKDLQTAFKAQPDNRENFGPAGTIKKASAASPYHVAQGVKEGHRNHIHESGFD